MSIPDGMSELSKAANKAAREFSTETEHVQLNATDVDADVIIAQIRFMAFACGFAGGAEWEASRSKWISVKERLPEADTKERVIVSERYEDGDSECRLETWYYNRWEHLPPDTNYCDHHKCEITHWMPLVDPPEPEGGE